MVWRVAGMGWYPRARLFAYPSRSRSRAHRAYGQLGRRYYDQLDLAGGRAFYYGCPQLVLSPLLSPNLENESCPPISETYPPV